MTIEQLKAIYDAQPFRPFVIHLADGRAMPVDQRDFLLAPPTGRTIAVWQPPDDAFHIIDLLLVTALEVKRSGNGTGKRRKG
ncbi:MAG TPA: hypothetical protein VIK18_23775 [Pirellulales bacterium]